MLDGLKLVQWFLRVIAVKKPRYWIMENVPRVALHLPDEIPYSWIGIEKSGTLPIQRRSHFNTADFGVPQSRTRYLIGNYPDPVATHLEANGTDIFSYGRNLSPRRTLRSVLEALPKPEAMPGSELVRDPVYPISIEAAALTDHFYDTTIGGDEAERIEAARLNHPYMGRMAFPDELDKPARTVVATQLGRETLIIATSSGKVRRATVRECASLQSFPITYQFCGKGISSRYRQAGDAVPPLLGYAIAREISRTTSPIYRIKLEKLSQPVVPIFREGKRVQTNPLRKFSQMVPGKEVRGSRVELDNFNLTRSLIEEAQLSHRKPQIWCARLHLGEGKATARSYAISAQCAHSAFLYVFQSATEELNARAITFAQLVDAFLRKTETTPTIAADMGRRSA